MICSLIVAMDEAGGIGYNNRLPWHLSADLQNFKQRTMGHHLIMGRKTFESIGKPLKGRTSVVGTRNPTFLASHPWGESETPLYVANSLEAALQLAEARGEQEVFITGGANIFRQTLDFADRLYLTKVHAHGPADIFFPPFSLRGWTEVERFEQPADEKNEHAFTFQLLEKSPM
jgi:dihydrofolate reductase